MSKARHDRGAKNDVPDIEVASSRGVAGPFLGSRWICPKPKRTDPRQGRGQTEASEAERIHVLRIYCAVYAVFKFLFKL